ncbi:MAG: site-specific DNA-methyltransferase [Candidatus Paceibacterota bacterium]
MSQHKTQQELIARIKELEIEVRNLKSRKKYGLVWEEKPEDVVLGCEKQIPVLEKIKDRKIVTDNTSRTNFLIEGDNYHALSVLNYTHKGKIDVIYIDPPYNTGNKDFIYNDDYVDREDSFRHSKWLSFMNKRLRLAKELLKDSGVIFISIDDNEQAQLKLLCDSIFGENNFVNNFMWLHGKGKKDAWSRTLQQYNVCYSKNKNSLESWSFTAFADYDFKNPDNDPRGPWFSGSVSFSEDRSNKKHKNYYEVTSPSGKIWKRQWQCTQDEMKEYLKNKKIFFGLSPLYESVPRLKIFPDDNSEQIPQNIIDSVGTTRESQKYLDDLFGKKVFDYPKPVLLIKHIISMPKKNSIILDFMAGSGTTGHAVMELNKEDGGNRQFILCTNNENNICEDVTYERLKRAIKGYKNQKGEKVAGLGGNLEYLKCEFVDKTRHTDNMKMRLMRACTEMLCLKENTFDLEKEVKDGENLIYRIYYGVIINDVGKNIKHMVGIYYDLDDSFIDDMRSDLKKYEETQKTAYIFTLRNIADYIDDYRKWRGIDIEEVPQKILEIYENIYKRNSRN